MTPSRACREGKAAAPFPVAMLPGPRPTAYPPRSFIYSKYMR
jgi:hypothetical protein